MAHGKGFLDVGVRPRAVNLIQVNAIGLQATQGVVFPNGRRVSRTIVSSTPNKTKADRPLSQKASPSRMAELRRVVDIDREQIIRNAARRCRLRLGVCITA